MFRAFALTAFVLVAVSAHAQLQHHAQLRSEEDHLSVTINIAGADISALFGTMRQGLRARVEYRIRISTPRTSAFSFLGDRLLREYRFARESSWDPYLLAYVVADGDGTERVHYAEASLYRDMFTLADYRIPWNEIGREPGLVVEVTTEYTPIVFVSGLNILSLFTANRSETSPWSRQVIGSSGARR